MGIPRIFWKFILTGLISYRIQQGSLANTKYLDYSLDSERITQIIGKIIKRSSEMAKIAIPAQDISENSEKSMYFCVLIEEINLNPFVDILGYNYFIYC